MAARKSGAAVLAPELALIYEAPHFLGADELLFFEHARALRDCARAEAERWRSGKVLRCATAVAVALVRLADCADEQWRHDRAVAAAHALALYDTLEAPGWRAVDSMFRGATLGGSSAHRHTTFVMALRALVEERRRVYATRAPE